MIIPISDHPNPRGTPWMTVALIAVNVAVYALSALHVTTGSEFLLKKTKRVRFICKRRRSREGS
jgi:hypothetical protein